MCDSRGMKNKPLKVKNADLLAKANGVRNVADALGITTQAVYAWGEDVPLLRVYQLMTLKPEWFKGLGK